MNFPCPQCHVTLKAMPEQAGKQFRCPKCRAVVTVPAEEEMRSGSSGAVSLADTPAADAASAPGGPAARKIAPDGVPEVWQPGDVILDLYEVKEELGKGGFGTVHKVFHRGWNTHLAVKSPLPGRFRTDRDKEKFVQECETWVNLGLHPHTVSCHYVRILGDIPRVFAEYVEGGSLAQWIAQGRLLPSPACGRGAGGEGGPRGDNVLPSPLAGDGSGVRGPADLKLALDIAIQIGWGMAFAHSKGLIHRDLKPANVLMTPDGRAQITDFGLARQGALLGEAETGGVPASLQVSTGAGTPGYVAPEQVSAGATVDHRADIFAFGVTLWRLLGGPITRADDIRKSVIAGHAVRALLKRGEPGPLPQALVDLILRCLAPEPDDRWPDFAAVCQQLRAICEQEAGEPYARPEPQPVDLLADGLNNRAVSLLDLAQGKTGEESQEAIERAITVFDEALQCDPHHVQATYNRGLVLWRNGRITDTALPAQLSEVRENHPDSWEGAYCLGLVHLERADAESAVKTLEEALRLGATLEAKGDVERARLLSKREECLRRFKGHKDFVQSVCLSADGRWALSGSWDKTLRLWELSTGRCLRTFEGHTSGVNCVCVSSDGRWALSGSGVERFERGRWTKSTDNTVRLWDVSTGRCLRTFEGHTGWVKSVCLSADGRWALSGSEDKTLRLWEVSTGRCLRTFEGHTGCVASVCFSADDQRALSGSWDGTLRLWEVSTGRCLRTFDGHTQAVASVCMSGDGNWALSGSDDNTLRLWDVSMGRCIRVFEGHTDSVNSVCLSADGRWALSGSRDKTLGLWWVPSGQLLRTYEQPGRALSVCVSADCCLALSVSEHWIRLWDVGLLCAPRMPWRAPPMIVRVESSMALSLRQMEFAGKVRCAQFQFESGALSEALALIREARYVPGMRYTRDAMALEYAIGRRCVCKSLRAGWFVRTFEGHKCTVYSVCFSRRARYALSGSEDNTVRLWEVSTGRCMRTFEGHKDTVYAVCLTADGRWALSGSEDKTVRLWDVAAGRPLRIFKGHTATVRTVCLSADGRWALSGSDDKTLRLWDVAAGRPLRTFEGHTGTVRSVCLSADGRWALSGSWDETLRLWDVATGRLLRTFKGHTGMVLSVCLNSDYRWAVSGSEGKVAFPGSAGYTGGSLCSWDVSTGRCVRTFEEHMLNVRSVCLSADGRWVLSGSFNTLRLWEVSTGRCLHRFQGHTDDVFSLCLGADGRWALSGSKDNTLRLWELDWEYEFPGWADWDEGARPYLETFLTLHTPYGAALPEGREPTQEEISVALSRSGSPAWTDADFQQLLVELQNRGFGWLRPEGVRRALEKMAAAWQGPPPAPWEC